VEELGVLVLSFSNASLRPCPAFQVSRTVFRFSQTSDELALFYLSLSSCAKEYGVKSLELRKSGAVEITLLD
jgi:hypothetical protein